MNLYGTKQWKMIHLPPFDRKSKATVTKTSTYSPADSMCGPKGLPSARRFQHNKDKAVSWIMTFCYHLFQNSEEILFLLFKKCCNDKSCTDGHVSLCMCSPGTGIIYAILSQPPRNSWTCNWGLYWRSFSQLQSMMADSSGVSQETSVWTAVWRTE